MPGTPFHLEVNPQIPPNTGNLIRLCANTGNDLHLVEPIGFSMDDTLLRRGGLDYHERTRLAIHPDLDHVRSSLAGRFFAFSSHGTRRYTDVDFRADDVLVFGTEQHGLGVATIETFPDDHVLTIPMLPHNRSLNLANAVAIVAYEAWRQRGFDGAGDPIDPVAGLTTEKLGTEPFDR